MTGSKSRARRTSGEHDSIRLVGRATGTQLSGSRSLDRPTVRLCGPSIPRALPNSFSGRRCSLRPILGLHLARFGDDRWINVIGSQRRHVERPRSTRPSTPDRERFIDVSSGDRRSPAVDLREMRTRGVATTLDTSKADVLDLMASRTKSNHANKTLRPLRLRLYSHTSWHSTGCLSLRAHRRSHSDAQHSHRSVTECNPTSDEARAYVRLRTSTSEAQAPL